MSHGDDKFEDHYQRQQDQRKDRLKNLPGEDEEPLPPPVEPIRKEAAEPGRNDPCPCGSGKKFKQCCLGKK